MRADPSILLLTHLAFYIQSHRGEDDCYIDFQCTRKYLVEVPLGYDSFCDWCDSF